MYKFDNNYEDIANAQIEKLIAAINEAGSDFDIIEKEVKCTTSHSNEFYDVYEVLCSEFEDWRIFDHQPSLDELNSNEYQNNCEIVKFFLTMLVDRTKSIDDTMKQKLHAFFDVYFDEPV